MAGNRAAAIQFILTNLEAILPGNSDVERYKTYLEGLSEQDFKAYMLDLRSGTKYLTITAPNFGKTNLNLERNRALAEKLKVKLFHRLWFEGK